MTIDRLVFAITGGLVLASLGLGLSIHRAWFLLTAFVGLNMVQAALTRFCPLALFLKAVGARPGAAFD